MPTITLVCNEFPPIIMGGVGNTARVLANNYSKIKNLKVNVVTARYNENKDLPRIEKKGNLTIYRIKAPNWLEAIIGKIYKKNLCFPFYAGLFSLFNKKLIKESDLIHSLHVRDVPFFRTYGKPVVLNISDFYSSIIPFNFFKYPYKWERGKFYKYLNHMWFRILDRLSIDKAMAILCECYYAKNIIEKNYMSSHGKTFMIHKGIDFPKFKKVKKEIDILFIGSRFEIKGAKEVLYAVNLLKKKYPKIKCLMIGRYSKFDYDYEKFINENNLKDKITILGNTPHDELIKYLLKSKIYVIPTHLESLAQTTIEAMACKVPVISSNVGGQPEAVTQDIGFIVEPTDYEAIAKYVDFLLQNPKKAKEMGEKSFKKAKEEFSEELMVKKYIEVYNLFLPENKKIIV
ncbi:MAG: glycosyltransferase family 4 protein [Nanoarchaeota archaeon]